MSPDEQKAIEQMRLTQECHAELAAVTRKYLGKLWHPLLLGCIEHIKAAAVDSFLAEAKKSWEDEK